MEYISGWKEDKMSEHDRKENILEGSTVEEIDAANLDRQRRELADYTLERQGINSTIATKDIDFQTPGHVVGLPKRPVAGFSGAVKVVYIQAEESQTSAPNIVIHGYPQERGFASNLVKFRRNLKPSVKKAA